MKSDNQSTFFTIVCYIGFILE